MENYERHVTIDVPVTEVWDVLADIVSVAKFSPTITESRLLGEPARGVGARRYCRHTLMGDVEEEVVSWEEGRRLGLNVYKGLPPPVQKMVGTYVLDEQRPGSTQVNFAVELRIGWGLLGKAMRPLLSAFMRREMVKNLAGLKYYVETEDIVTSKTRPLPLSAVA